MLQNVTSNSTAPIRFLSNQTAVNPSHNPQVEIPQAFYDAFEEEEL